MSYGARIGLGAIVTVNGKHGVVIKTMSGGTKIIPFEDGSIASSNIHHGNLGHAKLPERVRQEIKRRVFNS